MTIADVTGDYRANLKDDWADFVQSVKDANRIIPDQAISGLQRIKELSYHTGGSFEDVQAALQQLGIEFHT